jgi:hypothetical protein
MIPETLTILGVAPATAERRAARVVTLKVYNNQEVFMISIAGMMSYVTVGPLVPPVVPPFKVAYPAMPSTVNTREQTPSEESNVQEQKVSYQERLLGGC